MERVDSFIIDPHKWLFNPSGSCALICRNPLLASAVHTQHNPYIDVFRDRGDEWSPSHVGYQLTRRAAGLPLWFALVVHGTDAFTDAVRRGVALARHAASTLAETAGVDVIGDPELSVVLFRRAG
ncbi:MAG: pyridoxal-dependent decarboxylase [Ilumatobacteraceae bacterium]